MQNLDFDTFMRKGIKAQRAIYKNREIFINQDSRANPPIKIPFQAALRYYMCYPKNAKPKSKIPYTTSDFNAYFDTPSVIWLGHSSGIFGWGDFRILIDPVFCAYASPIFFVNRAFKQAHIFSADTLHQVDILIITHDHYDHLSKQSILALKDKTRLFLVPLQIGAYLRKWGIESSRILELDWWEGICTKIEGLGEISITATPSQHGSARNMRFNTTLWASFVLEFIDKQDLKRVFWSGDGGYGKHFKEIGKEFGSFDLACLESGQFNQAWRFSHSFPNEILQEALDLRTKTILPIHWGRFLAGSHGWSEVATYLKAESSKHNLHFVAPQMGAIYPIGNLESKYTQSWWQGI